MLTRTPAILLGSYGSLNSIASTSSISSTSCKRQKKSTRQCRCNEGARRGYATIVDNGGEEQEKQYKQTNKPQLPHVWPKPTKGQPHPTPYQIFDMRDGAAYSKTRYYELVKLYHPDRSNAQPGSISRLVRLERYRLIVAAHNILSDPVKRNAYDRVGAGWGNTAQAGESHTWDHTSSAGPFSRSWNDPSDPVWRNATWEDWERYYEWRDKKYGGSGIATKHRPSPLYMSNSYFIVLVAVLALMGSTANQFRAHDAGAYFIEQREVMHDRTVKELRRVKADAIQSGSRQDRIEWFLRNREATLGMPGSDLEALRQERLDRLLPDREVCDSQGVVSRPD